MNACRIVEIAERYSIPPQQVRKLLVRRGIKPLPAKAGSGKRGGVLWGKDALRAVASYADPDGWRESWRGRRERNRPAAMLAARLAAAEFNALRPHGGSIAQGAELRLVSALSRFAAEGEWVEVDGCEYSYSDDAKVQVRTVPQPR